MKNMMSKLQMGCLFKTLKDKQDQQSLPEEDHLACLKTAKFPEALASKQLQQLLK